MTTEYDIDTPADMELLGGTDIDEAPAEDTPPAEAVAAEESSAPVEAAPEAAPEGDPEDEPAPAKRDAVIPRARFDEVNAKLHAEREEVERLRAELNARGTPEPAAAVIDVDSLEDQYFEAILNGDKELAKSIRANINREIYTRAEAASTAAVSAQLTEREAKTTFANAVAQTVADYPFLDSNSPEASAEAIAEVVEWRDFYMAKGDSAASALLKAAKKVAPSYAAETPAEVGQPVPVVDKRKQAAAAAAARVTEAQPPRVDAGVGNRAIPAGDSIIGDQERWEKASDAERLRYLQ